MNLSKMVKKYFKSKVDLIVLKKNYGFAKGMNIGMKYTLKKYDPDYIYLLNNDTLVQKGWLNEAIKCAESQENIGIVGSKQLTFDNKPSISAAWIGVLVQNIILEKKKKKLIGFPEPLF